MADININIKEFECEDPNITQLEFGPSQKAYEISFTSLGDYYQANVDPGTTIELWHSNGGTLTQYTASNLQFNETGLIVYFTTPIGSTLYVELRLITNYCTSMTTQMTS